MAAFVDLGLGAAPVAAPRVGLAAGLRFPNTSSDVADSGEAVLDTVTGPGGEATAFSTGRGALAQTGAACVDAPCLASMIFGLSAGSSIGRVSGL